MIQMTKNNMFSHCGVFANLSDEDSLIIFMLLSHCFKETMDGLIIGFRPHSENVITTYLHLHVTIIGFGRDSDYSHF